MHRSCTADNLQFKITDSLGKTSGDDPGVEITFRNPWAGAGQGREEEGRPRPWGEGGGLGAEAWGDGAGRAGGDLLRATRVPTVVRESSELEGESVAMALCAAGDAEGLPPARGPGGHRSVGARERARPGAPAASPRARKGSGPPREAVGNWQSRARVVTKLLLTFLSKREAAPENQELPLQVGSGGLKGVLICAETFTFKDEVLRRVQIIELFAI